jgi:hypothetical protein
MRPAPPHRSVRNATTTLRVARLAACRSDASSRGTGRGGVGRSDGAPLSQADAEALAELASTYGRFDEASTGSYTVLTQLADNREIPQARVRQVGISGVATQSQGAQLQSVNCGTYEALDQAEWAAASQASGY